MKSIKNLLVTCILLFSIGSSFSQGDTKGVILYKTIEDFKSNQGERVGKLADFSFGLGRLNLKVDYGNKSVSVKDYWGFTVDSSLFRVSKSTLVRVMSVGNIVYYENGTAHLRIILSSDGSGWVTDEAIFFYSNTLTSTIYSSLGSYIRSLENPDSSVLKVIEGLKVATRIRSMSDRIAAVRKCIMDLN